MRQSAGSRWAVQASEPPANRHFSRREDSTRGSTGVHESHEWCCGMPSREKTASDGVPSLSNVTSGRVGELRPWLLGAALVDGWWWLSRRIKGRPWPHRDDFGALHSDDHWQREAVPEYDDARPQREPLWEPHGRAVKRVNSAPFSRDVPILAAVVLYPRGPASDWQGAVFWNQSADVVPQTGLDLRAVVSAAASGQQHCGERQRSGRSQRVHRLDSPALQEGSQACERDASVNLSVVGECVDVVVGGDALGVAQ